jgi:hypothetical protein
LAVTGEARKASNDVLLQEELILEHTDAGHDLHVGDVGMRVDDAIQKVAERNALVAHHFDQQVELAAHPDDVDDG